MLIKIIFKSNKKTSRKQFELLLSEMEESPEIARGIGKFGSSKFQCDGKWETLTTKLNSEGLPTRTTKEWKKVRYYIYFEDFLDYS